jgi:hypothetical protein
MAYFSNLFHFTCQIIFFSSLSPTYKAVPLPFTWMTLPPPQTPPLPVFPRELYYQLHYSPFIFLTCHTLHTPTSPYMQMTLPFCLLSQSWQPDTISHRLSNALMTLHKYFTTQKLRLNTHKIETILFSKRLPPYPRPCSNPGHLVPWVWAVCCLGLLLDSKLRFTLYLRTITNKAKGLFCNIFPLVARDSAFTQSNKLTLYKLLIWSILTYTTPVWSSTSSSNYLRLQIIQTSVTESSVTIPDALELPTGTTL